MARRAGEVYGKDRDRKVIDGLEGIKGVKGLEVVEVVKVLEGSEGLKIEGEQIL